MFNLQKTWLSYLFICSGITRIARGIILVYMHTITYAPQPTPALTRMATATGTCPENYLQFIGLGWKLCGPPVAAAYEITCENRVALGPR